MPPEPWGCRKIEKMESQSCKLWTPGGGLTSPCKWQGILPATCSEERSKTPPRSRTDGGFFLAILGALVHVTSPRRKVEDALQSYKTHPQSEPRLHWLMSSLLTVSVSPRASEMIWCPRSKLYEPTRPLKKQKKQKLYDKNTWLKCYRGFNCNDHSSEKVTSCDRNRWQHVIKHLVVDFFHLPKIDWRPNTVKKKVLSA